MIIVSTVYLAVAGEIGAARSKTKALYSQKLVAYRDRA